MGETRVAVTGRPTDQPAVSHPSSAASRRGQLGPAGWPLASRSATPRLPKSTVSATAAGVIEDGVGETRVAVTGPARLRGGVDDDQTGRSGVTSVWPTHVASVFARHATPGQHRRRPRHHRQAAFQRFGHTAQRAPKPARLRGGVDDDQTGRSGVTSVWPTHVASVFARHRRQTEAPAPTTAPVAVAQGCPATRVRTRAGWRRWRFRRLAAAIRVKALADGGQRGGNGGDGGQAANGSPGANNGAGSGGAGLPGNPGAYQGGLAAAPAMRSTRGAC